MSFALITDNNHFNRTENCGIFMVNNGQLESPEGESEPGSNVQESPVTFPGAPGMTVINEAPQLMSGLGGGGLWSRHRRTEKIA